MRAMRVITSALVLTVMFVVAADAAPVMLTLKETSVLYNDDPAGAPLPLGRTQYDAGDVLLNGRKIAEYLRVKNVHAGTLNTAAVTLTIFIPNPAGGVPTSVTLQGSHDFGSGNEVGSISACSSPAGVVGVAFTVNGGTDVLTLLFP